MNNRMGTIVATGWLVAMTSGCCANLSNLWFGRGAACGLCTNLPKPQFGNCLQAPLFQPKCCAQPLAAPAPCPTAPYQPAPYQPPTYQPPAYQPAPCQAPPWQAPRLHPFRCRTPRGPAAPYAATPDCGCPPYSETPCGETCYGSAYGYQGDCGSMMYGDASSDPYLGGHSMPYEGQIIDGGVIGEHGVPGSAAPGAPVPGSQSFGPPIQSDQFVPRGTDRWQSQKFDTDGNRIIWEEPLPEGVTDR